MTATVQYIGNEGTAVLAVDNFMRNIDAVKKFVTEKAVRNTTGTLCRSPDLVAGFARLGQNFAV